MNAFRAVTLRQGVTPLPRLRVWLRNASSSSSGGGGGGRRKTSSKRFGKFASVAAVFGGAAATSYYFPVVKEMVGVLMMTEEDRAARDGPKFAQPELKFEPVVSNPAEDQRKLLSSQNLQVLRSWEHPGVYVWGSNVGRVVDPESEDKYVKQPRRLKFFDDKVLRDLKLTNTFGAAVTEKGDLVQWGLGFSKDDPRPVTTVKGKDLAKIDVSADRIIALARDGSVYAVPSSQDDLKSFALGETKAKRSSWSLWGSSPAVLRTLTPGGLGWGERVTDISSGLEHCLLLTSKGRVFSLASSSSDFPSKGQMGIPGLTWETKPQNQAYDVAHEITALKDTEVVQIATGDYHSAVLDKAGNLYTFGDNLYGQLGFDMDPANSTAWAPVHIPTNKLYYHQGKLTSRVTGVAAGGNNTYFSVDVDTPAPAPDAKPGRRLPPTTSDVWAFGQGVYGALGTGKWTHVSATPGKIKGISGRFEFDEKTNSLQPIRVKALNIGTTHCAAVMDNATNTSAPRTSATSKANPDTPTNWGSDVVFWGGNEYFQLGTGKRNNLCVPGYIPPFEVETEKEKEKEKGKKSKAEEKSQDRLCLTPRENVRIGEDGRGRRLTLEQRVECGRFVSGVYSGV
ncbi:Alpha-tubulin suppressor [Geosmithia morbida]|uniref:Alpha-tubulin suppressor n=1 Tax=Geosmithia morbida TaxID=1094350 RepID=A0A9P4Z256_9HYPO|nr:Alpha-tubulin suppressor [Geosmithia morbida]KAF4126039.1 Alpha-tubulin suppressor [Geosmithia morbida]